MCIQKLTVKVQITHPCINQLELRLSGPGPFPGDQNYFPSSMEHRVALYTQRYVNCMGCAGGTHYFEIDDESQPPLFINFRFEGCGVLFEGNQLQLQREINRLFFRLHHESRQTKRLHVSTLAGV